MEKYARFATWIMNTLGVYYAWTNLGLDMTGREPREFLQAVMWGVVLCICRYISTKYIFSSIGTKLIVSKKGRAQKVSKVRCKKYRVLELTCLNIRRCIEENLKVYGDPTKDLDNRFLMQDFAFNHFGITWEDEYI
jgi:hypothetical protein